MTVNFPYFCLSKEQLIGQMNLLASLHTPFFFLIDYKAEHGYVIQLDDMDEAYVQFQFEGECHLPAKETVINEERHWDINPISLNEFQPKFDFVQKQIHAGNSFLVNLTQPTPVRTNLSLYEMYTQSHARYKVWIKDSLLVLSPETFIRTKGRAISSYPMKGTIDATIPNAEEVIMNDPKEMAEHATIVDLIRNDLSLVAEHVEVKRYRYVETIKTNKQDLLQVSSEITGLLPNDYLLRLGDILFDLLPAGSICGAPKAKTLEIIQDAEGYDRGYYTGICGCFDGANLDAGVMIRYMEQDGEQLIFKSGGGITARSEMKKEYEELIQKVYVPFY
jgi:para-aminobenzoate synthetase component I